MSQGKKLFRLSIAGLFCFVLFQAFNGPCLAGDGEVDFLSDDFYSEEAESEVFNDPLEPVNRLVFQFNDTLYIWVMEPVATLYSRVIPMDLRGCIENFFRNLKEPVRLVNTLLQGRFEDSLTVLVRFLINTTLGVYGLADAAGTDFGFSPVEATMGETLEKWGLGDGFYLVIPLYGPSTLREITGDVVDGVEMTPYYSWSDDLLVNGAIYVGKQTNSLSLRLGQYEEWKKLLFDPYVSFRNAYFQHRRTVRSKGTDEGGD
ncbi:MAG: VacJ family lipoprotein [Desulfobulbaceae bacterium]